MALALEGTPVHNNASSGTSLVTSAFTTTLASEVYIAITLNATTVSSITGGGLTWAQRKLNGAAPSVEIWAAPAASGLSAVQFTINFAGSTTFITTDVFAVSGHDTSTIFDANASIPASLHNTEPNSDPIIVSTSNADDFILAAFRMSNTASPTEGTGFTKISGANFQLTEYKIVGATQTNLNITIGTGVDDANGAVADAVMQATGGATTRGTPFGHRGTAFNGGRTFHGIIQ